MSAPTAVAQGFWSKGGETALRAVEDGAARPLGELLDVVQGQVDGALMDVEFKYRDGRYVYDVTVLDGRGVVRGVSYDAGSLQRMPEIETLPLPPPTGYAASAPRPQFENAGGRRDASWGSGREEAASVAEASSGATATEGPSALSAAAGRHGRNRPRLGGLGLGAALFGESGGGESGFGESYGESQSGERTESGAGEAGEAGSSGGAGGGTGSSSEGSSGSASSAGEASGSGGSSNASGSGSSNASGSGSSEASGGSSEAGSGSSGSGSGESGASEGGASASGS